MDDRLRPGAVSVLERRAQDDPREMGILVAEPRAPEAESPNRQQIVDAIATNPGVPLGRIGALVGLSWSTVLYHVNALVGAGQVRVVASGGRRLAYCIDGSNAYQHSDAHGAVSGTTSRAIAEAIALKSGLTMVEICAAVDRPYRSVFYHIHKLEASGLIVASSGRPKVYHATEALIDAVRSGTVSDPAKARAAKSSG